VDLLRRVLDRLARQGKTLFGYNYSAYDMTMMRAILGNRDAYTTSRAIIEAEHLPRGERRRVDLRGCPKIAVDHVDLAARLKKGGNFPGLKTVGANLCLPVLRELPYAPDQVLTDEEWAEVKPYNANDLAITRAIFEVYVPELRAMTALSNEHALDLRSVSKSAAVGRIFEKIYRDAYGRDPDVPERPAEVVYRPVAGVRRPTTPAGAAWFDLVADRPIRVPSRGKPKPEVPSATFDVGPLRVSVGSGGLHSVDAKSFHRATDEWELWSADVASYYPSLIDTKGIFPRSYGGLGSEAYRNILNRRLALKAATRAATSKEERRRLDVEQHGLKILLNATFGQFGSEHSTLFDPEAMISVTISGQLLLINLLERLLEVGADPISVNTDSVTFRARRGDERWRAVLADWESDTSMSLEVDALDRLLMLKTNIYATRDLKGKVKRKGGGLKGNLDPEKASNSPVIADAVVAAFFDDTPPEVTIGAEKNLARFCNVTRASSKLREGVAADDATGRETPLGKVTRWYRSTRSSVRLLQRLVSGKDKRPAKAEHVTLAQDLTDSCIPRDLDFGHYIGEARKVYNSVPGPHRFARALLPDHGPARAVLDAGLVPHPKNGKDLPLGSVVTNPTFLWDWNKYRTAGTLTGPEWGILALDVDEPGKFAAGVDRNGSPLLESRWADLEGCLVSSRGASHPDAVRAGTGRGKMLFRFHADAEHPLAKMPINRRKEALGVEVFFGRGVPSVAGEGPDGTTYQLDGTLGPPPEWLIDLLTGPYRAPRAPRKASPGTKGKKQVARGEGRGDLFSLDPRPSTLGPPVPSALGPRPSIRGPQDVPDDVDGGFLEDEAGDASGADLEALMEVLAEVEPRLDGSVVGWREKDLGDGRVIVVGRCPFNHDSETSSDGDLAAGFGESGRPWLRCQHASCTEVPDAAGRLAAEYLRRQAVARIDATRAAAPPLEPSAIARVVIASLDAGDVSIEKAPTGSGKSFSLGQAAVARLREDKVSLIACP
ncbi:MAG: hypothetical protein JO329_02250, partial [Planctomycetaceae bacterium]|nr:hypothetical protein [Planctomycetaceae bacterium]